MIQRAEGQSSVDLNDDCVSRLQDQIEEQEETLAQMRHKLSALEARQRASDAPQASVTENASSQWPLSPDEYRRYGRQMMLPMVGIEGQIRLKQSSVLVVGLGGLGCPAAAYLAGAGVGTIGLIDGDVVEMSNLHRQILHTTNMIGKTKVESVASSLHALNPTVKVVTHSNDLTSTNAVSIANAYDVILDCTDHPRSRYLISDVAVVVRKPVVSASALKQDGQLLVLNSPPLSPGDPLGGPCYRCIFPTAPPVDDILSCRDGGVLGPVVGVMGVLQALEAIKLITNPSTSSSPSLLLFSAMSPIPFRSVRLRARRPDCAACSSISGITAATLKDFSYTRFCGLPSPITPLADDERITATEYARFRETKKHILIDVRDSVQFAIAHLPGSVHVPITKIDESATSNEPRGEALQEDWLEQLVHEKDGVEAVYVVCRLGIDSQLAVRKIKGMKGMEGRYVGDVRGGYRAWREEIDPEWPDY